MNISWVRCADLLQAVIKCVLVFSHVSVARRGVRGSPLILGGLQNKYLTAGSTPEQGHIVQRLPKFAVAARKL